VHKGRGTTAITSDHDGGVIASGDATTVAVAAGLNLEAKEPEPQCVPTGRGTTVVTSGHGGGAFATGDATTVVVAAGLNLGAKGAGIAVLAHRQRHPSRHQRW
jgi:hypothetical protein